MLPIPSITSAETPTAELKAQAMAAFRALPESQAIGVVRALGDAYIEIEGPQTPILICPC